MTINFEIKSFTPTCIQEGANTGRPVICIDFKRDADTKFYSIDDVLNVLDIKIEGSKALSETYDCPAVILKNYTLVDDASLYFLQQLKSNNYWVCLETDGRSNLLGSRHYIDHIIVKPLTASPLLMPYANEVILYNFNFVNPEYMRWLEKEVSANTYFLVQMKDSDSKIKDVRRLFYLSKKHTKRYWIITGV